MTRRMGHTCPAPHQTPAWVHCTFGNPVPVRADPTTQQTTSKVPHHWKVGHGRKTPRIGKIVPTPLLLGLEINPCTRLKSRASRWVPPACVAAQTNVTGHPTEARERVGTPSCNPRTLLLMNRSLGRTIRRPSGTVILIHYFLVFLGQTKVPSTRMNEPRGEVPSTEAYGALGFGSMFSMHK